MARETAAASRVRERLLDAIQGAIFSMTQSIRREVFEVPWYGRTVNDVLAERLRGDAFYATGREVVKAAFCWGEEPREEDAMKAMYGERDNAQKAFEASFDTDEGKDEGWSGHDHGHEM